MMKIYNKIIRAKVFYFCLLSFCFLYNSHAQKYDIVIKNGRVVDGSGNPWFAADVAVKNGKIAGIGFFKQAKVLR